MNIEIHKLSVAVAFVVALALPSGNAIAYSYCTAPTEPSCVGMMALMMKDEFSFRRCRSDIEKYHDEIGTYIKCLLDEANSEKAAHARKLNALIERFNCNVKGGLICG